MKFVLALLSIAMIVGCSSLTPVTATYELIDRPETEQIVSANIGDTVVEKGKRYTFRGVDLMNHLSKGSGFTNGYEIAPQKMAAVYEDKKYTYYSAERMLLKDLLLGTMPVYGGLCISKTTPRKVFVYIEAGRCIWDVTNEASINPTTVIADTSPGFVQELIYNGRTGEYVKFLYREFTQDIARPAFSQEVQYDLGDGNVIGFKDARIEIVSATNTELRYKVLQSFPDPE